MNAVPAPEGREPMPVLYSFRRCPYAMRARLAITASGLRCELREVVLRSKPAELLAASPQATVPVLVLPGGRVMAQSLEIMHWALAQNDPCGWLVPENEGTAAMELLIAANDASFKHHLDRYKYPNRYWHEHTGHDEPTFARAHQSQAAGWLMKQLQGRLTRHAWLFGNAACLADMAILPFVRQFAHTDRAWFDAQPWPHISAWLAEWEAGPLFGQIMEKYPPWQPGRPGIDYGPIE